MYDSVLMVIIIAIMLNTFHYKSEVLNLHTQVNIILPSPDVATCRAGKVGPFPTLYLLHGYSDDEWAWLRYTDVERLAGDLGLAVVCPNVHQSYYANMVHGPRYWDFISEELPAVLEAIFPMAKKREQRFAGGLSMGGLGAFKLALMHPERYSAAFSLSGALNMPDFINGLMPDNLKKYHPIWGDDLAIKNTDADVPYLAERLAKNNTPHPRLYTWCGIEDFFLQSNRQFNERATQVGLELSYQEGKGDHSWPHWAREIGPALNWLMDGYSAILPSQEESVE